MVDLDEDFVGDESDDETARRRGSSRAQGASRNPAGNNLTGKEQAGEPKKERWEVIGRSWENITEDASGSLRATVAGLLEANKRLRLLRDTTPIQRGIIRHLTLILDLSLAMSEKDLRPTRFLLTLRYAREFIVEYFEQNPISQLSIIGMRDGLAVRISDMGGNPTEHLNNIQKARALEPKGPPSLQNALEMARASLFHAPTHGTREVLIIFGALSSSDPGDIHQTISALITDKIQVRIVGLAAQVAVCRELVTKTNNGDDSGYGVVLNEGHFRDLMFETTNPPIIRSKKMNAASLLMMGFPSRIMETHPSLCSCHSKLGKGGYLCSRCSSKVCALPTECPTCGLTLILSTHLARSYHHLFPLKNWVEVSWKSAKTSTHCFSCLVSFPMSPTTNGIEGKSYNVTNGATNQADTQSNLKKKTDASKDRLAGTSPSQRYACPDCQSHFCIDCDIFAHESLHNCPGCLASLGKKKQIQSITTGTELDGQICLKEPISNGDIRAPSAPYIKRSNTEAMEID